MEGTQPRTEEILVARCLAGDDQAWRDLITRHQGIIYSAARRVGLSTDDAADVFQRVCILLYQRLGAIRDPQRLPGWLATTTTREAVRAIRRLRRDLPLETSYDTENPQTLDPVDLSPLADSDLADLERAQILRSAITELSERCRLILTEFLKEETEANYRDIARRLEIPIGSIGPTRARCFARLRQLLRERGLWEAA